MLHMSRLMIASQLRGVCIYILYVYVEVDATVSIIKFHLKQPLGMTSISVFSFVMK